MVLFMKDYLKTIRSMDMDDSLIKMEMFEFQYGLMIYRRDMQITLELMGASTKDIWRNLKCMVMDTSKLSRSNT